MEPISREEIIEELNLVPENKVPELFDVVHEFRKGCHESDSKVMQFAGSWAELTEDEFKGFLEEVSARRARAFYYWRS